MQTPDPARPRTKPAQIRLEELMDAAEALFLSRGVDATTISDIVAAADVAKGTFYTYFASKAEILQALAQRYTRRFLEALELAVQQQPAGDGQARLRAWIQASIETYARTHALHDIVYANHHHHDRGNGDRNAILLQLQGILEEGAAAGLWPLATPRITASLIYAGVHGATDDLIADPAQDPAAFAAAVAADCLRMVGATGTTARPARRR